MIVNSRGSDVGVSEPFLHLGDVGLAVERVGRRSRPQRMWPDLESERGGVPPNDLVDRIRRDRLDRASRSSVGVEWPEEGAGLITTMPSGLEVIRDEPAGRRMQRDVPCLPALARNLQMRHAAPIVPKVLHRQLAQLFTPQRVVSEGGQHGAVALALEVVSLGGLQ